MTLRPGTDLVVQRFQYKEGASDNSLVMQLFSGGLRAITGLIARTRRRRPSCRRTATIGIRARTSMRGCASATARASHLGWPRPGGALNAVLASAKLVATQGEVVAVDSSGVRRRLVDKGLRCTRARRWGRQGGGARRAGLPRREPP